MSDYGQAAGRADREKSLRNIDTEEGILEHMESPAGLMRLARLRREYAVRARETGAARMQDWIVAQSWFLSADGNCGRISEEHYFSSKEVLKHLKDVVRHADVEAVVPRFSVGYSMTRSMPEENQACSICGQPWTTIEELKTARMSQDGPADRRPDWHHRACRIFQGKIRTRDFFTKALEGAGFAPDEFFLEPTPNGYWPDSYEEIRESSPWFRIHTRAGIIHAGWRKRVVSIEWKEVNDLDRVSERMAEALKSENVTKDETIVHAWGLEKAIQYFGFLREALRLGSAPPAAPREPGSARPRAESA